MSLDILFCAHNRLAYTRQSFEALLANTQWDLVERLCIADDASEDGSAEYLLDAAWRAPCERIINDEPLGGPVAAMNWYLSLPRGPEQFAKVDNDVIVPPGWLKDMWQVLADNPELDVLGMQASREEPPRACPARRGYAPAHHIGGVGLIRRRIFDACRPIANGRWGWSESQGEHPHHAKAWVAPPLPVFCLDELGGEPWQSLTASYVAQGWQRPRPDDWPSEPVAAAYCGWWEPTA